MDMRTLGNGLASSAVGLGCMGLSHGYGPATDSAEAMRLIREAYDMGYRLFDTAETYGTAEHPPINEELVGRALADVRDDVSIVTKFGIHFDYDHDEPPYPLHLDSRPETVRASLEGSLRRLGTDHVDLYLQHRIDPDVEPEEVAGVMADLVAEGKVLHWGISEATEDYLRRAHAVCPVCAVENRYSMMARWHADLFPVLEELGVGFIAFSPLANGFLTQAVSEKEAAGLSTADGDYRAAMPQFAPGARERNRDLLDLLDRLAATHDATSAQVSLAWMIAERPYIVPIPGSTKRRRLEENAAAGDIRLSAEEVAAVDAALDAMGTGPVFGGSAAASHE